MRSRIALFLVAFLALSISDCQSGGGYQAPGAVNPVAQKPTLEKVSSSKAESGPQGNTRYDVLPANVVRITLQVPILTTLDVYQDGRLLTRATATPGTPITPGTWVGDIVSNTTDVADWAVVLNTTNSVTFANPGESWIAIRDRSPSQNVIGRDRVSDALNVCLFDSNPWPNGCPGFPPITTVVPPAAGTYVQGLDCQCTVAPGPYVAPADPRSVLRVNSTGSAGTSPNNVYHVQFSPDPMGQRVQVTTVNGGALQINESFDVSNNPDIEFSFSPNDLRFAYSFTAANNSRVTRLLDASVACMLPAPPAPQQCRALLARSSGASEVLGAFSPTGKFFVYGTGSSGTGAGTASIEVLDASTGATVYQSPTLTYASPAGASGTQFPPVRLGFSPGLGERTFTYWYTGPTTGQRTAVNLATTREVLSASFSGVSVALFSPCGDLLAHVIQSSTSSDVSGFSTNDGRLVGTTAFNVGSSQSPSGRCTGAGGPTPFEQQITIGGSTKKLANNAAPGAC